MSVISLPAMHTLLEGGSRSTKTFTFLRAIAIRALAAPGSRHAALRFRFNHIKASIIHDTFPKMMSLCYPEVPYHINREDWFAELPSGSQIWFSGLDDKERTEKILGQEYATLFFNECSQIPYASRNLAMTRLAQKCEYQREGQTRQLRLKAFYDQNPPSKAHWGYQLFHLKKDPDTKKALRDPENYASLKMNPRDNPHLPAEYMVMLAGMPAHLRKRFLDGEYAEATPNALWTEDALETGRILDGELPDMQRIVVAVDPSGAGDDENSSNDEIGIIVAGLGTDGIGYVLEDCTLKAGPAKWGGCAVSAFDRHDADAVVGETNFGGEMVKFVVETAASKPERDGKRRPTFKKVTASRGKAVRAEPIAALFETGKAKLVGEFRELETELCAFSTSGYTGEGSPNRADAMVWAFSALFPGMVQPRHDTAPPQVVMSRYHQPRHGQSRDFKVIRGR